MVLPRVLTPSITRATMSIYLIKEVIEVVINKKYLKEETEKRKAESVKLNSKEKKQINARASELGLGFSTYMRSLALTDSEKFAVEDK